MGSRIFKLSLITWLYLMTEFMTYIFCHEKPKGNICSIVKYTAFWLCSAPLTPIDIIYYILYIIYYILYIVYYILYNIYYILYIIYYILYIIIVNVTSSVLIFKIIIF